jgi:hypothetical protein
MMILMFTPYLRLLIPGRSAKRHLKLSLLASGALWLEIKPDWRHNHRSLPTSTGTSTSVSRCSRSGLVTREVNKYAGLKKHR